MRSLLIISFLLLPMDVVIGQPISNYALVTGYGICRYSEKEVIVLRKFSKGSNTYYFVVSPQSLNTEILRSDSIKFIRISWEKISSRYSSSPYVRALKQAENYSDALQDAGFTRFMSSQKGIDLTIDLCPSKRPLDRIVFIDLINEMGKIEKPVPIAISITGRWINMHPDDLNWLKSLVGAGDLSIVWINHSYNHFTDKNIPLNRNFMLESGTDINTEVLNTEIALLQRKILPSVFFRFPGLVSDHDIYDKILSFGLIPVGSDAWLAKGQRPGSGSIVLIHANGNEPLGVLDFIDLLKKERTQVLSGRWELFDLRESLVDDESK
jgi:hypothetical protein